MGQILSPGANLASQLTAVGGALASQIEQKGKADEAAAEGAGRRHASEPRTPDPQYGGSSKRSPTR